MDPATALPSYLRTAAILRQRVATAPAGGFLPAERDLAVELGVGRNTLRQAIRTLADEGLVEIADNCRPRIAPRAADVAALPTGLTHIALLTPVPFSGQLEPGSGEFVNLISAAVTAAEKAGVAIVYINTTGKDLASPAAAGRLLAPFYHGAIFHALAASASPMIAALAAWGRPAVVVGGGTAPAATCIHTVDVDQAAGAAQAVAHLIACGRRRIVHLTYDEPAPWVEARADAFRGAMAATSREGGVLRVASTAQIGREDQLGAIGRRIAEALPRDVDAVVAANDFLAACLAQRTRGDGRRIPADLAIIGFDDVRFAVENDLTSIASMAYEQGGRAVRILLDAIAAGPAGPCHRERIAPRLVLRGSTPSP